MQGWGRVGKTFDSWYFPSVQKFTFSFTVRFAWLVSWCMSCSCSSVRSKFGILILLGDQVAEKLVTSKICKDAISDPYSVYRHSGVVSHV